MATTRDISGNVTAIDGAHHTHKRTNAGNPNSSLTPAFAGEIVLDTTNGFRWRATGVANTTWVPVDPPYVPAP